MVRWVMSFVVLALLAGLFGFTEVVGESMLAARVLFVVFVLVLVAGLVLGQVGGKRVFRG